MPVPCWKNTVPSLREFQTRFVTSLFDDDPPGEELAMGIQENGLSATRRLAIYRNNLLASLTESLGDTYPAIRALVGDDFFRMLARRYVRKHPSRSGDLHAFGEQFESFLAGVDEAASLPWISDLARLEWLYHLVFHAAEETPLDVAALACIEESDHDRVVLRLHPASALTWSRFPLTDIWRLGIHGDEGSATVDLDAGPAYVLIARRKLEMTFQSLLPAEYAFVEAMTAGRALVDCAAAAFEVDGEFALGAFLGRQFALGNITGAELADRD